MARPRKTDPPRDALLLSAAEGCFLQDGYAATTVERITATAGVSKATFYLHYADKAAIFEDVVVGIIARSAIANSRAAFQDMPVREGLRRFASDMIAALTTPLALRLYRLAIGEASSFPHLAQMLYARAADVGVKNLAPYLEERASVGEIALTHPTESALMFIGMVKEAIFWPALLGDAKPLAKRKRETVMRHAVDRFLMAHARG